MEENVATRLKLFIDTNGLSTTQFADMCGIARPTLSQILSGRNKKISDVLVGQIHRCFPDLSILWLLFGEGPVKTGFTRKDPPFYIDNSNNPESGHHSDFVPAKSDVEDARDMILSERREDEETSFSSSRTQGIKPVLRSDTENSNLSAFNSHNSEDNTTKNQLFESDLKILDLKRQIEQMKQNPRKVVQITIYYDDSTFETFIPK